MEQRAEAKKQIRDSSFELLRILCILGILYMHMLGEYGAEMSHGTRMLRVISDSIFNAGVTCFILISGYFGIKRNKKKLICLDLMIIFYNIIGLGLYYLYGHTLGLKDIVSSFLPVLSGKYWFISCYFFLAFLAPYIDILLEQLNRTQMEKFILLLIALFYVIPTFFCFQILQDNGKGLPNMIVIYIIGRYLGKYPCVEKYSKGRLLIAFSVNLCIIVGLNLATGKVTGGLSTIWSRDCSLFILLSAVLIFLLFSQIHFQCKLINRIAGSVLAVYIFSPYVQFVMGFYFEFEKYDGMVTLPIIILGLVFICGCICVVIDQTRKFILDLFTRRQ